MKTRNKLLVLLLSVALICAGIVFVASADTAEPETVSYEVDGETVKGTLADAIKDADEESTVTLLGDCTVSSAITVGRMMTLDLNGYSITTTVANAFNVNAEFTVTGTGTITSAGTLFSVSDENTLNVDGKGNGIIINQTGTVKKNRLISLSSAYLYVTNVTINSDAGERVTADDGKKREYTVYNIGSSYVKFDKVDFTSTVNNQGYGEDGYFFINVTENTTLDIYNSAFYSRNFLMRMSEADGATVNVKNSVISVTDKPAVKGGRLAIMFATCEKGASNGTINVYDSTLECSGRMFASEKGSGAPEGTSPESISVNAYGTTFKVTWAETDLFANANASYLQRNGKSFKLYNSDSGRSCKIITIDGNLNQNTAVLYAMDAGLRVNLPKNTTETNTANGIKIFTGLDENGAETYTYAASSADDNWVWVYDPIGDADAPYVLVDTTKTTLTSPDYHYNMGLDGLRFNQKDGPSNKALVEENVRNTKVSDAESYWNNMQMSIIRGSLYSDYETANAYIKYVVTKYVDGKYNGVVAKSKPAVTDDKGEVVEPAVDGIYGLAYTGSTRTFSTECAKEKSVYESLYAAAEAEALAKLPADADEETIAATKAEVKKQFTSLNENNTFFVTGKNLSAKNSNADKYVNTGFASKKVVVVEFDYGTDSAIGFPAMNFQAQSRALDSSNAEVNLSAVDMLAISNQGNITNNLKTKAPGALTKLNFNEWYKISAVFYTETNTVYLYINGTLMGSTTCYGDASKYEANKDKAYVQGVRINVNQGSTHKIDAAFCVDNISTRAYADYQNGETSATTTAENGLGYISTSSPRKYIDDALTVNGRPMASIDEAVAAANGAEIDVNDNINLGDIKVNAVINSNGNTVAFGNNAYGRTESDGVYTLNENYSYNAYYYTGDVSKLYDGTYTDADFTLFGKAYLGNELNIGNHYTDKTNDYVNNAVLTQNGWVLSMSATDAVLPKVIDTSDLALADENGNVYYLPFFDAIPMFYVVKDAEGNGVSGGLTNQEAVNAMVALKDGETFTLFEDMNLTTHVKLQNNSVVSTDESGNKTVAGVVIDNDYTDEEIAAMRNVASDIKIDLNGNKIYTSKIFYVSRNVELSIYSSKPGAEIISSYYKNSSGNIVIDRTFGLCSLTADGGVEKDSYAAMKNNYNAHLNLGTYTDRNGNTVNSEKVTVTGSFIFDAMTADPSCSINAENITAVRVNSNSKSLIVSRYSAAKMNFNDSVFAVVSNGGKVLISFEYTEDTSEADLLPQVVFDNCAILTDVSTQNMVSNGGPESNASVNIIFSNCVANGRLNPAERDHVYFGEGTAAQYMSPGKYIESGLTEAYVWEPMVIGNDSIFTKIRVPVYDTAASTTNYENYIYFVDNGRSADFAAENPDVSFIELPVLTTKVAKTSDVVNVTFNKLDGTALRTIKYVKGTDVRAAYRSANTTISAIELTEKTYNGSVMTLTATGWGTLPTNVQENTVITPECTVTASVSGLKANLSLYADFGVNLYIPATYADYATVSVGGEAVALTSTTRGGVDYLAATVNQMSNMAGDDIVYTIALNETVGGILYTAEKTVTISIASYAAKILAGEAYTDSDKVLMYYMLNYANEADKYIDGAANATVAALLTAYAAYGDKYAADYNFGDADTAALAQVFTNVTVDITSTPAFIFNLEDGFEGTVTVAYANGYNTRAYTFTALTDRTLVIEGMKVYSFATVLNVTATGTLNGEEVNVTGTYSFDAFAKYHSENAENSADSAACVALVNALSAYAEVADLYKAGTLADALVVTE